MNDIPSSRHLALARKATDAFGFAKDPVVQRFWDDRHESWVDILSAPDTPRKGAVSFSTIGLSDHPLMRDGTEFPARLELLAVADVEFETVPNMLATAAFCVINSKWFCAPGSIFSDIVEMHGASKTLQDLYFVPPFPWGEHLRSTDIEGRKTAWLLAVPVSRPESDFANANGPLELEKLLEREKVDFLDLNRPSIV